MLIGTCNAMVFPMHAWALDPNLGATINAGLELQCQHANIDFVCWYPPHGNPVA